MATKNKHTVVSSTEWMRRTSLMLRSRGKDMLELDNHYAAWSANPTSPLLAGNLYRAMEKYRFAKGNMPWAKVERNKASGGLMEYIFETVKQVPGVIPPSPSAAQAALEKVDIPHSRYGVLYLLGNIDIDMALLQISLEGVSAVGGAVGSGLSTNMQHLDSAKEAARKASIMGQTIETGSISAAGAIGVKVAAKKLGGITDPATKPRHHVGPIAAAPKRSEPGFPLTLAMYEMVKEDPILMLNPFVLGGTVATTAVAATLDALNSLRILLQNAIIDLAQYIMEKISGVTAKQWATIGAVVKGMAKFVVGKCMVAAAPLIGGLMDLGTGLMKTIRAAKERIGAWAERRQIVINPGHPELLANGIEAQMNKGMFEGLWTILKGVASTALAVFLPGAGSLVSALVTGLEWLVKMVSRVMEQTAISQFLHEARREYLIERQRSRLAQTENTYRSGRGIQSSSATSSPVYGPMTKDEMLGREYTVKRAQVEVNLDPQSGGIIHDLPRFTEFFKRGCEASPLIPMLTLNAGICGSLMTLMRLFDDAKNQAIDPAAQVTATGMRTGTFDVGNAYFTRLKSYSRHYLANSGFEFRVRLADAADAGYRDKAHHERERTYIQALLTHAVRDHVRHDTVGGKAMSFLTGEVSA